MKYMHVSAPFHLTCAPLPLSYSGSLYFRNMLLFLFCSYLNLALRPTSCVTSGKLFNLSVLQFPYLENEDNNSAYLIRLL